MILSRLIALVVACGLLGSCQFAPQNELRPVKVETDPQSFEAIQVTSPESTRTMTIRHMVANGNVFVECYVPDFNFEQEATSQNEGHLLVSVDNKAAYPVYKAAFIIKELSSGSHHIRVQLADQEGKPIKGLDKRFLVQIK